MIAQLRQLKPFLHLGFNRQSLDSFTGQVLTIYQDTIYNKDYVFSWSFDGGLLISENANELVLKTDNIELINISINVNGVESDPLKIDCKEILWNTREIKFNNTEITFDTL